MHIWEKIRIFAGSMKKLMLILLCFSALFLGCSRAPVPRPYGYYRIAIPDTAYLLYRSGDFQFDLSKNAVIQYVEEGITVHYPTLNADIHCTYKPVRNNLKELTDDALEFVYKHVNKASAIPEKSFANDEEHVWGVFFELEGNTASPYQFFVTDSTHHFFRGASYCYCQPNADSLAPILDYLKVDMIHMVETFEWK